jgi:hypothetical protein
MSETKSSQGVQVAQELEVLRSKQRVQSGRELLKNCKSKIECTFFWLSGTSLSLSLHQLQFLTVDFSYSMDSMHFSSYNSRGGAGLFGCHAR